MDWIKIEESLPEKDGRYFVLLTFDKPCICNGEKVRKNIPFAVNFTLHNGWMNHGVGEVITHWMEVPILQKE